MSQFSANTQTQYIGKIREFLGENHPAIETLNFELLKRECFAKKKGRRPNLPDSVVWELEDAVNQIAARCDSNATTFTERFELACKYNGLRNSQIGHSLGVSRELIRLWREGIWVASNLDGLADALEVPRAWLELGGGRRLPANSPIGVRVGMQSLRYRDLLHVRTLEVLSSLKKASHSDINEAIDTLLNEDVDFSSFARRAGGRWLLDGNDLVFGPWHV